MTDVITVTVKIPTSFCPVALDEAGTVEEWAQAVIDTEIALYKEADEVLKVYALEVASGHTVCR